MHALGAKWFSAGLVAILLFALLGNPGDGRVSRCDCAVPDFGIFHRRHRVETHAREKTDIQILVALMQFI